MPSRSITQLTSTAVGVRRASGIPVGIPGLGFGGETAAAPDAYAANGFSPDYVADFSAASADYFRVAGNDSDFDTAFTSDSEGGGLATQNDSSGNLVWRAHNLAPQSSDLRNLAGQVSVFRHTVTPNYETGLSFGSASRLEQTGGGAWVFEVVPVTPGGEYTFEWLGKDIGGVAANYRVRDVSNSADIVPNSPWPSTINTSTYTLQSVSFTAPAGCTSAGIYVSDNASPGFDVAVGGVRCYRSDLGGMANNPDTGDSYVETSGAARYLARRRHHRWDGSAWVPTLLHEPVGATNRVTNSNDFTQSSWTKTFTTISSGAATGPDGNSSLSKIIANASTTSHQVRSSGTATGAHTVTAVIGDAGDGYFPALHLFVGSNDWEVAVFNPSTGAVTQQSSGSSTSFTSVAADSEELGGGLYRIRLSGTSANSVAYWIGICSTGTPTLSSFGEESFLGDGTSGILAGFTQNEGALVPSSYIPTTGASVTRSADTCKVKAAALPYDSTAMSMAMALRYSAGDIATARFAGWYQDGSNQLELYSNANATPLFLGRTAGTFAQAQAGTGNLPDGVQQALSLAGRINTTANEIQAAKAGAAAPAVAFAPAMPPLSDDDLFVFDRGDGSGLVNGEVDTLILWSDDIAQAGLESTTS